MGYPIKQSQTAQPLLFLMVDSADHISPKTGLSPTVTLSKSGGSFASPAGAVTEVGNGWYKVAGNATDANTLGPLLLHATATGADPTDDRFDVVAYDPQDAVRLGLTALPNAAAGANGGLPLGDASGDVTVGAIVDDAVSAAALSNDAVTAIQSGLATAAALSTLQGYLILNAGTVGEVPGSQSMYAPSGQPDTYGVGCRVHILANTGAGQTRVITGYSPNILGSGLWTIDAPWTVNPDASSLYVVVYDRTPKLDSSLRATDINSATILGLLDTEVAAILAAVDTEIAAIKAKTDNLPADPADQSAVEAAIAAAQSALTALIAALNNLSQAQAQTAAAAALAAYDPPTNAEMEARTLAAASYATAANQARLLGLSQENWVWDNETYDGDGNLTAAVIYAYDSAANATTHDGSTGLVGKWNFSGTYSGGRLTLAKMLKVS